MIFGPHHEQQLARIEQELDRVLSILQTILTKEITMSKELDDLTAEVNQDTQVESSAVTAIQGIEAQLAAAGTDPVKLEALKTDLANSRAALAAAIANTTVVQPTGAVPTISSITPSSGEDAGGEVLSISGTGFTGATNVLWDGITAGTNLTVNSDTSLSVTSPAGIAGSTSTVTVVGPNGTSAGEPFTYA